VTSAGSHCRCCLVSSPQHRRRFPPFIAISALAPLEIGLAFITGFPAYQRWCVGRSIRSQYEAQPAGNLGPRSFSLTDDGILEESVLRRVEHAWSAITLVDAAPEALYLYTGPFSAFIVPRRSFPDGPSFNTFAKTAQQLCDLATASTLLG
jgi:YcxB-like protein